MTTSAPSSRQRASFSGDPAVHATTLRARPAQEKASVVAAVRDHVWPLIDAGQVAAVIDRELPMSQAAQAHRAMASSEHIGKILLRPD